MAKKKPRSGRKPKKQGPSLEDEVPVYTSLPPMVEGQLRCFLRLSVNQILWLLPTPPELSQVRVKWWGEEGLGAVFRPLNVKGSDKTLLKTTARYAIRSGPKQLTAYLTDMGPLVLEVLSGVEMTLVGQAQIDHINTLSPVKPINGFFPVMSANDEKIAELQVSLSLETLTGTYDSSGSVPTTDMSTELPFHQDHQSAAPPRTAPLPHPRFAATSSSETEDPFKSPAPLKTYRISPGDKPDTSKAGYHNIESRASVHEEPTRDIPISEISRPGLTGNIKLNPSSQAGTDLVSELLERGSKLKEAMVMSTVDRAQGEAPVVPEIDAVLDVPESARSRGSSGSLLKEILERSEDLHEIDATDSDTADIETRAVDLVFGANVTGKELKALRGLSGHSDDSMSSDEEVFSDIGDPVHDDSILHELFYKNPDTDSSSVTDVSTDEEDNGRKRKRRPPSVASLEEPGNIRPPSRQSSRSSSAIPPQTNNTLSRKSTTPKKTPEDKGKRRKSLKKRTRSHSRDRSGSDLSDSDARSVASRGSEGSRVSFDMTPSDAEENSALSKLPKDAPVDGLSVERLTLLGRVSVGRVVVDSLKLDQKSATPTPRGKSAPRSRGKPPRPSPKPKRASTYFVEYQFPVVATSRDKYTLNTMATEVMRVASKKVKDGVVTFNHRSVFPVLFDGTAVEKWWKSLLVFKVFAKSAGQKVPNLIGTCSIPLKAILKSENLHMERSLEVKDRRSSLSSTTTSNTPSSNGKAPVIGSLQVYVELASDHKDFSTALAKTKLAEMKNPKIVPIPQPKPTPQPPPGLVNPQTSEPPGSVSSHATQTEPRPTNIHEMPLDHPSGLPRAPPTQPPPVQMQPKQMYQMPLDYTGLATVQDSMEAMTLHTLLLVPEGRNINLQGLLPPHMNGKQPPAPSTLGWTGRDMATRNLYLVCRMFWCDDAVTSSVCWGTFNPVFNFVQIGPVLVTQYLLERMRNNFMVLEVWDKKTGAQNDKLVGIVKLSLHQFYMSFRDRKICRALLKSQYPVVSVDNWLPVQDPFTGIQFGQLKVLLAVGSAEQVSALQRLKLDKNGDSSMPQRPQHYLERQHVVGDVSSRRPEDYPPTEVLVEHVFEFVIEGVKGLKLFDDMIWGEADCFIQYHFPAQQQTKQPGVPAIQYAVPTLKPFRTATTLCIPDPTFHEVTRHRILLPEGTPVQRELVTACAGAGGGGGGVPIEVWCRYYYPNVRDQVIAKAVLPLAKLCAMVTMQKRGEPSVQTFSLPLTTLAGDSDNLGPEERAKLKEAGLLEVTVHYKTNTLKASPEEKYGTASHAVASAQVCISVGIVRASGLKAAAVAVARHDDGMQYPAEVGVNAYVRTRLSFLSKQDERITRTVARTFAPEFSYFMDFPCPLLWTEEDSDALCLAEILETAEVTFEMWHQVPGLSPDLDGQYVYTGSAEVTGRKLFTKTGDVLLGTTTIPLLYLLTHKTGLHGWYPVHLPSLGWAKKAGKDEVQADDSSPHHGNKGLERVVGGLEVSLRFAHHDDRGRVIHAARGVGWAPEYDLEDDWESADESSDSINHVTVHLDMGAFPLTNALIAGQTKLDKNARCYVRYKFFDKAATLSRLSPLTVHEEGYIVSAVNHQHNLNISRSAPFLWYLKEERLEVQLWVSYSGKDGERAKPRHRDKLIGCAYIDLESLADRRRRQHRVSGMYPLFKPGVSSLGGAFLRAHVTLKPAFGRMEQESEEEVTFASSDENSDVEMLPRSRHGKEKEGGAHKKQKYKDEEEDIIPPDKHSFAAHISIERALHLPVVTDKHSHETGPPNSYVAYQTAEKTVPSHTNVVPSTGCPLWEHQHDTRLSKDLLYGESKHLVFKVWHKPKAASQSPDKSVDRVLGFVSVDLSPLLHGLKQICGWYNIMDFSGQCQGQIKVSVVPQEILQPIEKSAPEEKTTPKKPFGGMYASSATYPSFPAHLSWYPEQQIRLEDHHSLPPLPPHHEEHYQNVKKYHEQLHQQGAAPAHHQAAPPAHHQVAPQDHYQAAAEREPLQQGNSSSSFLFSNLRSNMRDLDDITRRLQFKLASSKWPDELTSQQQQQQQQQRPQTQPERHGRHKQNSHNPVAGIVHQTVQDMFGSTDRPHLEREGEVTPVESLGLLSGSKMPQTGPGSGKGEESQGDQRPHALLSPKLAAKFPSYNPEKQTSGEEPSRPDKLKHTVQDPVNGREGSVVTKLQFDDIPPRPHKAQPTDRTDLDVQLRAMSPASSLLSVHDSDDDDEILTGWKQRPSSSEGEEDVENEDTSFVVPKPLNDISSWGLEERTGKLPQPAEFKPVGPPKVQRFSEKDSWLSDASIAPEQSRLDKTSPVTSVGQHLLHDEVQRSEEEDQEIEAFFTNPPPPSDRHSPSVVPTGDRHRQVESREETSASNTPSPILPPPSHHKQQELTGAQSSSTLRTPSPVSPVFMTNTEYDHQVHFTPEKGLSGTPTPCSSDLDSQQHYSPRTVPPLGRSDVRQAQHSGELTSHGPVLTKRGEERYMRDVDTDNRLNKEKGKSPVKAEPRFSERDQDQDSSSETEVLPLSRAPADLKENIPPRYQELSQAATVPNFFLPAQDLEASMRALQMATALHPRPEPRRQDIIDQAPQDPRTEQKAKAANELVNRLSSKPGNKPKMPLSVKSRPLPTAEETKRIAKIFSSNLS
ncbi:C2 domain-containing protein 3-like [Lingula anatina]|uniref:C2 domain-containing protein 3-like n=1 Tax=Lingula anatina TaxID=7574 RepID=A0A1S3H009_LINAN|nr:C2 domain-containing protein 3-like [Lingula anatina]|eukprot:XP_013378816.1 C2 domain-containing protein 3-like [Lingula anatina]